MKKNLLSKNIGKIRMVLGSLSIVSFMFFSQVLNVSAEGPDELIEEPAIVSEEEETEINEVLPEETEINVVLPEETYSFGDSNDNVSFEDYIDHEVDTAQTPVFYASTFAGDNLTGINKKVYDKLKLMVAEVANGERASTSISISVEELGIGGSYTAAELGVSSTGAPEAVNALMVKSGLSSFDIGAVSDAVRADCPYERYWMGIYSGWEGLSYTYTESTMYFTGSLNVYIEPSYDYAATEANTVDTKKTAAVKKTINRINDILSAAQSKNDREKINYYRDEIQGLSEYNHAAADDPSTPYGDPWQLVYVFDGDENTTVVCEGFSKAFMYLCNKTHFSDSSINCYCVTGTMSGGPHMWNVMHWSDGVNYICDVTNCSGDHLFMETPSSGDYVNGYRFSYGGLFKYDDETLNLYSADEITLGVAYNTLTDISLNYDPNINKGTAAEFTVVRKGGTSSCTFRLDSVLDSEGSSILGGSYSPQFVSNNIFTVTFPNAGKYTLRFTAKDSSNTTVSRDFVVEVKNCTGEISTVFYVLKYDVNGGNELSKDSVVLEKNSQYGTLPTPTRKGFTFIGWFTQKTGGTKVSSSDKITADTTIYAHWQGNSGTTYKVYHYYADEYGGYDTPSIETLTGTSGEKVTPSVKGREGYDNPEPKTEEIKGDGSTIIKYYYPRKFYTLTWNFDGGTYTGSYTNGKVRYGAPIVAPHPTKQGFKFAGWTVEVPSSMPAKDLTISAKWEDSNGNVSNPDQKAQVKAFVERFYKVVLGREGEADGVNDWTNKLISGEKTGADVAKGFAMSKEFKNKNLGNDEFLKVMYKGFFDREPDEGGYNGWMQKMNNGTSREAVIAGFVNSQEFKNLCAKYEINPGKMEVSNQGQQNNNQNNQQNNSNSKSTALKLDASGVDDAQLDEYVERLYTKVLKRDSEAEGKEYWKKVIKEGKDSKGNVYDAATAARKGFFESKEYKNQNRNDDEFLTDLYAAFFNREPDEEGYAYWQNKMKNEGYSRERVIDEGFGHSKEFKNLLTSYGFKIIE